MITTTIAMPTPTPPQHGPPAKPKAIFNPPFLYYNIRSVRFFMFHYLAILLYLAIRLLALALLSRVKKSPLPLFKG